MPDLTLLHRAISQENYQAFKTELEALPKETITPDFLGSLLLQIQVPWALTPHGDYSNTERIFKYLLNMGANVNVEDEQGYSPLLHILMHNSVLSNPEAAAFPVEIQTKHNEAFQLCCKLIRKLLEHNANPNIKHRQSNETALLIASRHSLHEIEQHLLLHGAVR